jgi:hypothetical protein
MKIRTGREQRLLPMQIRENCETKLHNQATPNFSPGLKMAALPASEGEAEREVSS